MITCPIKYLDRVAHDTDFNTRLKALSDGEHKVKLFIKGIMVREITLTLKTLDDIIIPDTYTGIFNENSYIEFCVEQPSGTLLTDGYYNWWAFQTYINNAI